MAIKLCRLRGAQRVIALGTDRDRHRFALAYELGADLTVDVTQADRLPLSGPRPAGRAPTGCW